MEYMDKLDGSVALLSLYSFDGVMKNERSLTCLTLCYSNENISFQTNDKEAKTNAKSEGTKQEQTVILFCIIMFLLFSLVSVSNCKRTARNSSH